MRCFVHPQTNAVVQFSQCRKGIYSGCIHNPGEAIFCASCYESELQAEIAQVQRSTIGVWIFAGAITLVAIISSFNNAGFPTILIMLLAFAISRCLFTCWLGSLYCLGLQPV